MPATAVKRGCGTRVKGGAYAECGLSEYGLPLEHFFVDPPMQINPDELGLSAVGVTLIERGGTWHVLDWVGASHYPNPSDFIEEVRRFGMSRRLPRTLEFEKLTKGSKHILVHGRAWIEDVQPYHEAEQAAMHDCPKHELLHANGDGKMCARFWWQDVDPIRQHEDIGGERKFVRRMPSFEYTAYTRPEVAEAKHAPAIFLSLPIERIAVIRDKDGGTHKQAAEAAGKSGLPVQVEDE